MSIRAADCMTCLYPFLLLADRICRREDAVVYVYRAGFPNKAGSLALRLRDKSNNLTHIRSAWWAVRLPIRSCTLLVFIASSRSSECFGCINMRSFFSSPLVVIGKGLKLTRNRSVGHGLGSAEQSPCCL